MHGKGDMGQDSGSSATPGGPVKEQQRGQLKPTKFKEHETCITIIKPRKQKGGRTMQKLQHVRSQHQVWDSKGDHTRNEKRVQKSRVKNTRTAQPGNKGKP